MRNKYIDVNQMLHTSSLRLSFTQQWEYLTFSQQWINMKNTLFVFNHVKRYEIQFLKYICLVENRQMMMHLTALE